jgi:ABC-2 type transport system ATP-binding protein
MTQAMSPADHRVLSAAAFAGAAAGTHDTAAAAPARAIAASGGGAALDVSGVTVRYGSQVAVDDVSLAVGEGTVYALLGRNGAGKSSLVRCLLGQQRPEAGRVRLLGRDAWRERAAAMAEIGVVPDHPDAPPGASALRLAAFCRPLYPRWDGAGFMERLRRFGVPADLAFGRLSKGQQGQVMLALALAGQPRMLILDEPALGFDVVARRAFFEELIGELADRGTTVFLTTHDLAAVERIAERVGVLAGGRLLLDEDIEHLKQRFRRIWMPGRVALATGDALAGFMPVRRKATEWGVEVVVAAYDDDRFQGLRSGAVGADGAEAHPLSLEEIFLAVAGGEDPAAAAPAMPSGPAAPAKPAGPSAQAGPVALAAPAAPAAKGGVR